MNKVVNIETVMEHIKSGCDLMVGGFLGLGAPNKIIDEIVKRRIDNLIIISSDTALPDKGVGKIFANKLCTKLYASHIGTNPCTQEGVNSGEIEIEYIPQGTFARRIKCGGNGMGGFLTRVGLGTVIEEGKQKVTVDGIEYLIEKPLRASVAILGAYMADTMGNVYLKGNEKSFNIAMAMACDTVIVEAEHIVEPGEIDPDCVHIPFIFVDYIIKGDKVNG